MAWLLWGRLAWCPPLALQGQLLQQLCSRGRLFLKKVMPEGLLVACSRLMPSPQWAQGQKPMTKETNRRGQGGNSPGLLGGEAERPSLSHMAAMLS